METASGKVSSQGRHSGRGTHPTHPGTYPPCPLEEGCSRQSGTHSYKWKYGRRCGVRARMGHEQSSTAHKASARTYKKLSE